MRLDFMSEVASPSGRPDMGGSGSPAPSSARPRAAGCGPPDAAAEALGGAEVVAALPSPDRSGIGGSGADARPVGPDIAALDAGGGGCGGRPAATRWPAAGASPRSGPARWTGGSLEDAGEDGPADGVPDNLSNRSASVSGGSEVADAASGSGGLRPLLPGGVPSEFTALYPHLNAHHSRYHRVQFWYRPHALNGVSTPSCRSPIEFPSGIGQPNGHIRGEYGQRWEPRQRSRPV